MQIRLLGTAAGGGFPQWNCNCANCRCAREGTQGAIPRSQSCVALSGDGKHWFLLNASPDLRSQIESFPPLLPAPNEPRGTRIEGVLVTNADLDHTLGLFLLREQQRPLTIHASLPVRQALSAGLALDSVLSHYNGVVWQEPPQELAPLLCADGSPSGLRYAAFMLPGKPPRYREKQSPPAPGDCVGYQFVDATTGGRLLFMPDVAALNETARNLLGACDVLLLDGTFWTDNEMQTAGVGETPASRMGHWPVGGPEGSLAQIAALPIPRRIYMHINNTNPMLLTDSPERAVLEATGCKVGYDGMEIEI